MGATELLQFALAGLKNGSIYALVALGFTLVYAATGVINFAQGEFYMLGGMLSVWAYAGLGLPLPLAGLVGVVSTAAIGVIFELLAIRQRKDGDPLALIIITVGGSMVLSSMARHLFGPNERPLPLFSGGGSVSVFGAVLEVQTIWIIGMTAIAVACLWYLYNRTGLGRAMRACAVNRDAARIVGIDTRLMVTVSFLLAAGLGALAGLAVTPLTQTAFDVGPTVGIKGFAAAILGGLGNPIAAVVGGLVLGMLESVSIAFISSTYKDAIALVVLLAVLFVRPQGLLGRSRREKV
ncbi:MAG: branched-chain amino acid ABC transporter permease [Coriobacteriia bacterium]|nr:branched-chain amino acid ABC transporter permease [Coriobacteriia bacterium]